MILAREEQVFNKLKELNNGPLQKGSFVRSIVK